MSRFTRWYWFLFYVITQKWWVKKRLDLCLSNCVIWLAFLSSHKASFFIETRICSQSFNHVCNYWKSFWKATFAANLKIQFITFRIRLLGNGVSNLIWIKSHVLYILHTHWLVHVISFQKQEFITVENYHSNISV